MFKHGLAARMLLLIFLAVSVLPPGFCQSAFAADAPGAESAKSKSSKKRSEKEKMEKAFFAGGCFWKVQYIFSKVPGVKSTRAGYMGGSIENPSYRQVCSHSTGHAEAVEVEFDPTKVTYKQLLEVFFKNHDPTTLNRQGPDIGDQYRSAIFCQGAEQEKEARLYVAELQKEHRFKSPIVTKIEPAAPFFAAEEYHQDYFKKHGVSCQ